MNSFFIWDATKASANRRKHGVTFDEATTVFVDPLARIEFDPDHSLREHREVILGCSSAGRMLVVSFLQRDAAIRIITARLATRKERYDYEEA
jgi:uncharacterized DUF497 family protein